LFLVGGLDSVVLELNQKAMDRMDAKKELVIIPGATHLFEEAGKLEEVAKLSTEWFRRYLK
jgi:alpha-beta hydrolase superfamily lysophospholipase